MITSPSVAMHVERAEQVIENACEKRLHRAEVVGIASAKMVGGADTGVLTAIVYGSGGGTYTINIDLRDRGWGTCQCTCPDNKATPACKHSLAVIKRYIAAVK